MQFSSTSRWKLTNSIENPYSGTAELFHADGQMDGHNEAKTVAFRNSANALKNSSQYHFTHPNLPQYQLYLPKLYLSASLPTKNWSQYNAIKEKLHPTCRSILDAFEKLRKFDYYLRHVCPSVRMELGYLWTGFHENLYLSILRNYVKKFTIH